MKSKGIIITGSTGYLGSKLLDILDKENIYILNRNSFYKNQTTFFDTKNNPKKIINKNIGSFVVIHLATYFSKSLQDNKLIHEGNIEYGKKVLSSLDSLNIEKIIYTNTMFSFYKDEVTRNLQYTKTKNLFSYELNEYAIKKEIIFDEVFLDNTFGGLDNRKKVVPLIIESIKNLEPSPITDNHVFINLIFYKDVLARLQKSINSKINGQTCFINTNSINLKSIYDFLYDYNTNKVPNINILKFQPNNYLDTIPKVDLMGINLSSLGKELLNYFDIR